MIVRRQGGWATFEYFLCVAFVFAAMLVKVYNGKTGPELMVEAIKDVFANYSFGVSLSRLPTPY